MHYLNEYEWRKEWRDGGNTRDLSRLDEFNNKFDMVKGNTNILHHLHIKNRIGSPQQSCRGVPD